MGGFLGESGEEGYARHARFLVGVVGNPGTLVLDSRILLHHLLLPPGPSQLTLASMLGVARGSPYC